MERSQDWGLELQNKQNILPDKKGAPTPIIKLCFAVMNKQYWNLLRNHINQENQKLKQNKNYRNFLKILNKGEVKRLHRARLEDNFDSTEYLEEI
jgi:intergrase/recombinase